MSDQRFNAIHAELTATPSWERLAAMAVPEDFVNGPNCATPTRERESIRLFGQEGADLRLVLYRDHAGWCPYCHKVQMLIEAKKIPYVIKKINMSCYGSKPVEFLKLVPSGLLPVIELDGELFKESIDIMLMLEENFQSPYRKLIPTEDNDMMQAFHRYVRMERVYTGVWLGCLRGPLAMGTRAQESLTQTLDIIESSLGEYAGSFFYPGEQPSFVDINFCKSSLHPWPIEFPLWICSTNNVTTSLANLQFLPLCLQVLADTFPIYLSVPDSLYPVSRFRGAGVSLLLSS